MALTLPFRQIKRYLMLDFSISEAKIAVIGLGYVGLPLAVALADKFPTTGFDLDPGRLRELAAGQDRTGEMSEQKLTAAAVVWTADMSDLAECNIFIVTVPTPIDADNEPDLTALRSASAMVGKIMRAGAVVVFESTVYPGVTEDVCGPELEHASGLKCGSDFFLGYSPERINPGDHKHTVESVIKVVAGQTPGVAALLAQLYGAIVPAGIHVATDIRTAEAAKVIENAQRDVNIAFINEVTMIFQRLGIDTQDVLAAARTKWNFLDFRPGLVGGHCIGVDPYYLAHAAKAVGHDPEVILAGRRINDGMAGFVAAEIDRRLAGPSRILVLGLTFKENVPDLRNSKVADMVRSLEAAGHAVSVHDPIAAADDARGLYGIALLDGLDTATGFDAVIGAVAHDEYREIAPARLEAMTGPDALVVDLKGIWPDFDAGPSVRLWRL
jgi:UDP-N-acetyl-D-galactosamine dehydrogenase